MNRLFVFGLGYSATSVAFSLQKRGWQVSGTVRSPDKLSTVNAKGIGAVLFDDRKRLADALSRTSHLLVSIPPAELQDPTLAAYEEELRGVSSLSWVGYLSTIGVYGGRGGAWVDEESPAAVDEARAAARLAAENAWAALCTEKGCSLDVFRLAGIYGPGRNPLDRLRSGKARRIVKPGQVFNRIHVDDIVQVVTAAIIQNNRKDLRIFNVADDEPAPPQDVVAYAARLLGIPLPPEVPFEVAELSPKARAFYADNRRVRNDKIKRDLNIKLRYPTYREGLAGLLHPSQETPKASKTEAPNPADAKGDAHHPLSK